LKEVMAEVVLLARRTESGENGKEKVGCGVQEAGQAVILTKVASCQRLRPAPACMHMMRLGKTTISKFGSAYRNQLVAGTCTNASSMQDSGE